MPWRETSPMEQRMQFVTEYQSGLFTMTELAEQYAIAPKTGYKWIGRYDAEGVLGLVDRSRRPHHSPQATDAEVVEALVAQRRRHPRWGAKKLLAVLRRQQPRTAWPSRATVCTLLKQRGLVRPRARRDRPPFSLAPRAPITRVNEVWTTDFKGEFRTGDGVYCYPLTVRDGFSRFVLRCDALPGHTYEATRRRFERAFAEYGLPDRMRSDNGGPFASTGLGRLSRLSVWWMRLGIILERIAPGHPEQNGSHEQFHSVLKAETTRPPAANAAAQQRRFTRFCAEYNFERPHEALQDEPPASCYHASARPFPSRLPPVIYPGHLEIRRVSPIGQVAWRGQVWFLSGALGGEDVAFEEVDDGLWTVYFSTVALGRLDERRRRIQPMAPLTEGRSTASPPRA
jgi:transposase InsO family protein